MQQAFSGDLLALDHLPELGGRQPAMRGPAGQMVVLRLAEGGDHVLDDRLAGQFRPTARVADRAISIVEQCEAAPLPCHAAGNLLRCEPASVCEQVHDLAEMFVPVDPGFARGRGQGRLIDDPTVLVEHDGLGAGCPYVDPAEDHGTGPLDNAQMNTIEHNLTLRKMACNRILDRTVILCTSCSRAA